MAQVKNPKRIQERRKAITKEVNDRASESITEVVDEISKRLFISERTVWRDLAYRNNNTY